MSLKPTKPAAKNEDGRGAAAAKSAKSRASAEKTFTHAEVRSIFIGIMLGMFLGALDQTIVATALPTIGRAFNDVENLSWVVTAYLLTATAVTPLYGKLADIYGRRNAMVTGVVIFVIGSAACALAPSMTALIFARGLQGLGGGGLMALAQTIVADIVTPRERGRYQGYFGTVFATASVSGPVLGGFLAQHLHWSLIFWINLPLGVAALAMMIPALRRLPKVERAHKLDFLGAVLMMGAAVSLLLALTWGGTRFDWLSLPIIGLVLLSLLLWTLFVLRVVYASEPFLPVSVLQNPVVRCATLAGGCAMGTLVGLTIFVPLYFEVVYHLSASQSGLALIPLMGSVVLAATVTGRAMVHVDNYKRMPLAGLVVSIVSLLALAAWPDKMPIPLVVLLLTTAGTGMGCLFPVSTVATQNAVSRAQMGIATGTLNFFRSLSSALIVALFGAIVLGGLGGGSGVSVETLARTATDSDLATVFRFVFLAGALVVGFGLAFVIAMEQKPLRGPAAKEQPGPEAPGAPVPPAE
jgi:EmrB/QacA subfamily drug resistance transporter